MAFQVQPINYGYIGQAGQQVGKMISDLPATKEADEKRKLLKEQLAQLKIDSKKAEEIRQQRVAEAVVEYREKMGLTDKPVDQRTVTMIEARFYPEQTLKQSTDPSAAILQYSDADSKFSAWLDKESIKKFREGKPTTTGAGPAGPGYKPSAPSVAVEGQRGIPEMQRDVEKEMLTQPRTEVPRTSREMYEEGKRLGITETPEFKSDYQQQQDIEAGQMFETGRSKGEYLSGAAESGLGITGGAAKELGGTLMTDKDIATQKRLTDAAQQKERYQNEKLKIDGLKAKAQVGKLTADERLDVLNSKSRNAAKKLDLQIKLKKIENDLKTNAGKTDPITFQPLMSEQDIEEMKEDYARTMTELSILDEFQTEYDGLIKEKGGIRPYTKPTPAAPAQRKPLSSFER